MDHQVPAASDAARNGDGDLRTGYWQTMFPPGDVPVTELPLDRARTSRSAVQVASLRLPLNTELQARMRQVVARESSTTEAVAFALFSGLVHALARQADLLLGAAPMAFGATMLPLRWTVDSGGSLRQLASAANQALVGAARHAAELPAALMAVGQPGAVHPHAFFRFCSGASDEAGRSPLERPFDFLLDFQEADGGFACEARYNGALLDAGTIERWLGLYMAALQRWSDDADISLVAAFALTDLDRRLLQAFNATAMPLEAGLRIEHLIARQVAATPDAIAVTAGAVQLSFRELAERANGISQALQAHGVNAGDLVGLSCDRNEHMLVALYGILQAGAGYVPLDPSFPADRLAFMAEDAGLRVMVADAGSAGQWADRPLAVVRADQIEASRLSPATQHDPEAVAYVIYTSGSTGRPKGVRVPHRSVCNLLASLREVPGIGREHVTLAVTTLSFDIAVSEVLMPLTIGSRIVVADKAQTTDGALLRELIEREQVSFVDATPSTWRLLLGAGWEGHRGMLAICTGEPLPPDLGRTLLPRVQQLWNGYGPTETTVWSSFHRLDRIDAVVPIGRPVANTQFHVLDPAMQAVPVGVTGELYIGGTGVTLGYLNRPELTAERFVDDPFAAPGAKLYRTGDLGRWRADGILECLGRNDHQVKIRGYRIELGEIENALQQHPAVKEAVVIPREDQPGNLRLVAYLTVRRFPGVESLRAHLGALLPVYMVPSAYVPLDALPLLPNGKLDRRALPVPPAERPELSEPYEEGRGAAEKQVCAAFAKALGIDRVGRADNFFDLGGDSLLVLAVLGELQKSSSQPLSANMFFQDPTPRALALKLAGAPAVSAPLPRPLRSTPAADAQEPIALIAMAGRFPGAGDVEQFWTNLVEGRESISFFDDETLDAGVTAALRADPNYVRARGVIDEVEMFDAAFFGINPKEAQLMDPQQRLFLEICWECIERAGYTPDAVPGSVGVYAGMNNATYFLQHVQKYPELVDEMGAFQVMLGNEKDYIATRVAHRLNLTGPAIAIHTACSTSLVAVAQAFQALRSGQCDMALAGGIAVTCPPRSGYRYEEGAMLSPDGHTRSFDAKAQGTVFSDGAGVVLLKRLSDALADGDPIFAVLRGVAVNNDGGAKASFTAPNIDGQAAVISAALASAGVDARSISYVETHGTATPMGDPVEVEGLTRAFARHTSDTAFCRIGSVKSNVGHLVTAAGTAGLIKTALALHNEQIPATIHFTAPNPAIRFEATPFRVNDRLHAWPRTEVPRRAGVSSFGVGGTNAHVIVEEAPARPDSGISAAPQLLVLSARTPTALAAARTRLADHLEARPGACLPDVAHTLRVGRKAFAHRSVVVARSPKAAADALRAADVATAKTSAWVPQPVLMFPGQGTQYAGMGRALYLTDAVFRAAFDECMTAFDGLLACDLREKMFSEEEAALAPTAITQPATFVVEYAIARQIMSLGLAPAALVGHSIGEFAAAVLAGVMSLRDAARLVARRGALMQAQPAGVMLSVRMPAADLLPRLEEEVSLAAENGPNASVAAGPADAIERLRAGLEKDGIAAKLLQTSHAFHSAMMDPAVAPFEALVREVELSAPTLPIYSTLTGRLLGAEEAVDPRYWARHLRETVRFSSAVRAVLADIEHPVFVEAGPRSSLSTLVRQHATKAEPAPAIELLGDRPDVECRSWRLGAGRLWMIGAEIELALLDEREIKHRVPLPTYPFERKRFWLDIPAANAASVQPAAIAAVAAPAPGLASHIQPIPELPMSTATHSPPRRASLVHRLRELFESLSGMDMNEVDGNAPFVEIGLDSLTLTQAAIQVKKHFKVNLSFRQLMESYRSFDSLAEYLDATLPPDAPASASAAGNAQVAAALPAAPQPTAAAVATPIAFAPVAPVASQLGTQPGILPAAVGGADGTLLQQLIAQQMLLMQQQLALLSAAPTVQAGPVPTAPAVEQTTFMAAAAATTSNSVPSPAPPAPAATDEVAAALPAYDVKKAFGAIARIHTQMKEPTERQKARLEAFVRRYVDRTQKSKAFTQANRSHMADPRVVNGFRPATKEITYQLVVDRSKGSRLWDIDGNEYVDVLNGFGMNLFGWQPDFVLDAMRKQLDAGFEIGPQHPLAAEVTQLICEMTGFDRAGLCNTGSEAVMAAIRIARTVTGRSTVVLFTGSYHGTFDEVLVRAGKNGRGMSAAPGVLQGMFGDVRVLDYGTPETLDYIREHANDLAAVLVEPVQSRRPDFQPREFLRELRAITEKAETCLIFDEVITGFRSHLGGAQALFGVKADLASYGKVIGGGLPVGVIAGTRQYMDALDGGAWQYGDDSMPTVGVTYFAGTFVRHPLALAAAKVSLEFLKRDNNALQTQLNLHTAAMADELTAFCREVGAPLEIRYFSSLWRVSWLEDHPLQDLLFAMMRSRGVHILDNFPCFMTMAHSQQDIATIKSAFKESIAEMQEAEMLPRRAVPERVFDPSHPPAPDARLGRDKDGQPAWFVPDPKAQGKFTKYQA